MLLLPIVWLHMYMTHDGGVMSLIRWLRVAEADEFIRIVEFTSAEMDVAPFAKCTRLSVSADHLPQTPLLDALDLRIFPLYSKISIHLSMTHSHELIGLLTTACSSLFIVVHCSYYKMKLWSYSWIDKFVCRWLRRHVCLTTNFMPIFFLPRLMV